MLVDARQVARDTTLDTDVCIVGAGAAGISLARELAGRAPRVVMLESGGFEPDAATQALYAGRVYGRSYYRLDECRSRGFGGSTACWQGLCRPLEPIDFEARDWVPDSGWPFDAAALEPWYRRAREVCRLAEPGADAASWESPERPALRFAGGDVETRVFQVAPQRFGSLYRSQLVGASNLKLLLFANAVELETDPDAGRVERVRVACLDGNRFRVRARVFVLATGGIENARLLLASNRTRPAGLGNDRDLVGRHFMEHPHAIAAAYLPSAADLPLGLYRTHAVRDAEIVGLFVPSEAAQRREKLLGFGSYFAAGVGLPELETALARTVADLDGRGAPAGEAILLMSAAEQAPNPASRVRLIQETDALGVPRVQLDWRLSAIDQSSLRRGHELLARELGRAGLGRLQILLAEDDRVWPEELGGASHHLGTTRMHPDPARGVVDVDCRAHGLANLYVAGSSVFPTSGAAGPTLTLVALALRLADHVREVLG